MWHIYFPSVFHNNHAEKKEVTNSFLRLIFPSSNREKTYDTIRLCGKILIGKILSIYDYIKYILNEKYSVNRGPIFSQISINHKVHRGGSRRVEKFLQESVLIAFDFIWKV